MAVVALRLQYQGGKRWLVREKRLGECNRSPVPRHFTTLERRNNHGVYRKDNVNCSRRYLLQYKFRTCAIGFTTDEKGSALGVKLEGHRGCSILYTLISLNVVRISLFHWDIFL